MSNLKDAVGQDHVYLGEIPGMKRWGLNYELVAEWAGGEENVTIVHDRQSGYVLNLAATPRVRRKQLCCQNKQYDCGHWAYGPSNLLPERCPECK
jgi:hypothetical protein